MKQVRSILFFLALSILCFEIIDFRQLSNIETSVCIPSSMENIVHPLNSDLLDEDMVCEQFHPYYRQETSISYFSQYSRSYSIHSLNNIWQPPESIF
jgi:hypothetical protein